MSFDVEKLPKKRQAEIYREEYLSWKEYSLNHEGYFPLFDRFKDQFILRNVSGNALKLYLYLGLHAKNKTGECWVSIDTMAKYFEKSNRTISGWLRELEKAELIKRIQLEKDGVAFTFLRPY